MTADQFIDKLTPYKNENELNKVSKFFKGNDGVTEAFGVKFGDVFRTAKEFTQMSLLEINKLLDSDYYEIRMGVLVLWTIRLKGKRPAKSAKKNFLSYI